jgi:hypothetical protein
MLVLYDSFAMTVLSACAVLHVPHSYVALPLALDDTLAHEKASVLQQWELAGKRSCNTS